MLPRHRGLLRRRFLACEFLGQEYHTAEGGRHLAELETREIAGPVFEPAQLERLEQIIDRNGLRPVAFLEVGTKLARSVVHITVPDVGAGTGFFVSPSLLLTNNHVLPTASAAAKCIVRCNYQEDMQGRLLPVAEYRCDPERTFVTDAALDFTLVHVAGKPGDEWGYLDIRAPLEVKVDDDCVIVQHPGGRTKAIAISGNQVRYMNESVVQYVTDTEPGSSGSPVFDDRWVVFGLHHASVSLSNEAIRIDRIAKAIGEFPSD